MTVFEWIVVAGLAVIAIELLAINIRVGIAGSAILDLRDTAKKALVRQI